MFDEERSRPAESWLKRLCFVTLIISNVVMTAVCITVLIFAWYFWKEARDANIPRPPNPAPQFPAEQGQGPFPKGANPDPFGMPKN